MLFGPFLAFAVTVFSTNFDGLITLNAESGFLADNESMFSAAKSVLALSLNGFSLITVSFIVVFMFYGFGSGLYCGVVIFKWVHNHNAIMSGFKTFVIIECNEKFCTGC